MGRRLQQEQESTKTTSQNNQNYINSNLLTPLTNRNPIPVFSLTANTEENAAAGLVTFRQGEEVAGGDKLVNGWVKDIQFREPVRVFLAHPEVLFELLLRLLHPELLHPQEPQKKVAICRVWRDSCYGRQGRVVTELWVKEDEDGEGEKGEGKEME